MRSWDLTLCILMLTALVKRFSKQGAPKYLLKDVVLSHGAVSPSWSWFQVVFRNHPYLIFSFLKLVVWAKSVCVLRWFGFSFSKLGGPQSTFNHLQGINQSSLQKDPSLFFCQPDDNKEEVEQMRGKGEMMRKWKRLNRGWQKEKNVERNHSCKHFSVWSYKSALHSCSSDNAALHRN